MIDISASALQFCNDNNIEPTAVLMRHAQRDWGNVTDEWDVQLNERAIQTGVGDVMSSFTYGTGDVWVISNLTRMTTRMFLPSEY